MREVSRFEMRGVDSGLAKKNVQGKMIKHKRMQK